MARTPEGRERRKHDVRTRSRADADGLPRTCTLPGCYLPTMRTEGKGLSSFRCRYHVQFEARHGSPWKRSYTAKELEPFRLAARAWIVENREQPKVSLGLAQLEALLQGAGRAEIATRLRGVKPKERARIALARLRNAGIAPSLLLEIILAIHMIIKEDPTTHRSREFRVCQIAKACHRLASGHHQRWTRETEHGPVVVSEVHAYPRSSGQVLRHLGTQLDTSAEWIVEAFLDDLLARKIETHGHFVPAETTAATPLPNVNRLPSRTPAKSSQPWR